jgi:hypothetical protein
MASSSSETSVRKMHYVSYIQTVKLQCMPQNCGIRGLGQSVCQRHVLVQYSRNWSVQSDFERTVKFCLYSRGKHSPWLFYSIFRVEKQRLTFGNMFSC